MPSHRCGIRHGAATPASTPRPSLAFRKALPPPLLEVRLASCHLTGITFPHTPSQRAISTSAAATYASAAAASAAPSASSTGTPEAGASAASAPSAGTSAAGTSTSDAAAGVGLGTPTTAAAGASVDPREAAKFAALAASWWRSTEGPFAPLHALNPARVRYVRQSLAAAMGLDAAAPEPLSGLRVLDVGCGGGILSESLARLGAQVHGIDITRENVEAARLHAQADPRVAERVRYDVISAEDLAASGAVYDVVVASEVIEHVSKPHQLLAVLASMLAPPRGVAAEAVPQPPSQAAEGQEAAAEGNHTGADSSNDGSSSSSSNGGILIVSTLNRTPAAWAVAVAGAEYVARIVPPGTHTWRKFITPEELAIMAGAAGLQVWHAAGMAPSGPRLSWALTSDLSINYIATLTQRPRIAAEEPAAEAATAAEAAAAPGAAGAGATTGAP